MAVPVRSAFQPGAARVTSSHEAWKLEDEEDELEEEEEEEEDDESAEDGPIFSLSKSSVDVPAAAAAGGAGGRPLDPWDPAWTPPQRMRRSSSAAARTDHHHPSAQLPPLRPLYQDAPPGSGHSPNPGPGHAPTPGHSSPPPSRQGSACSTPDSVVWRGGVAPASPKAPPETPARTPISSSPPPPWMKPHPGPAATPTSPKPPSPPPPPPPLASTLQPISADLQGPPTEKEGVVTNPPPPPHSHRSMGSRGGGVGGGACSQDPLQTSGGRPVSGSPFSVGGGGESPGQDQPPPLPRPGPSSPDLGVCRPWGSPLLSSLSDWGLGPGAGAGACRCSCGSWSLGGSDRGEGQTGPPAVRRSGVGVDAAVQTSSPPSSWSGLRKNVTYQSHNGSQSVLGSPPGSRLNLRSPQGSTSNLVSPSSSMFLQEREGGVDPGGETTGEEDSAPMWETSEVDVPPERRRSCLKVQGEERVRAVPGGELGRRSSMKQVQWDEDGMTWDVHGSTLEPDELRRLVERHVSLRGGRGVRRPPPTHRWSMKAPPRTPGARLNLSGATEAGGPEGGTRTRQLVQPREVYGGGRPAGGGSRGQGEGGPLREGPSVKKGVRWSLTPPCCGGPH